MLHRLCASSLVALACSSPALAQVSDERIDTIVESFSEARAAIFEERPDTILQDLKDASGEAFGDVAINEFTAEQIAELMGNGMFDFAPRPVAEKAMMRLASIAMDESADPEDRALAAASGSAFELDSYYFDGYSAPEAVAEKKQAMHAYFLTSEGRDAVLQGEHSMMGLQAMLATPDGSDLTEERIVLLMSVFGDNYPVGSPSGPAMMWDVVNNMSEREENPISKETREIARTFAVAWAEAGAKHAAAEGEDEMAKYFASTVADLNSRAARGLLIGYPAPEMSVQWCSDENVTSLADLKGKVVILDFFATWCGPCIATFPQVRELRAMYPEEHVAIVGLTSPQGQVYNMPGGVIDCEGDVAKEIGIMPDFIKEHNITWTMMMLEGDNSTVFHPDFGVRGIPHVAILDANGVVRYNGLHPMDEGKPAKINALLKEAGLPTPGEG